MKLEVEMQDHEGRIGATQAFKATDYTMDEFGTLRIYETRSDVASGVPLFMCPRGAWRSVSRSTPIVGAATIPETEEATQRRQQRLLAEERAVAGLTGIGEKLPTIREVQVREDALARCLSALRDCDRNDLDSVRSADAEASGILKATRFWRPTTAHGVAGTAEVFPPTLYITGGEGITRKFSVTPIVDPDLELARLRTGGRGEASEAAHREAGKKLETELMPPILGSKDATAGMRGIPPAVSGPLLTLQNEPRGGILDVRGAARTIAQPYELSFTQRLRYEAIGKALEDYLVAVVANTDPGPERSTAISHARTSKFWASAGIALEGK